MAYLLLDRFRSLFDGVLYRHRDSSLGDSVAQCLPDDLYGLHGSRKFNSRIDARRCVVNVENRVSGVKARRGDGTFGEVVPQAAIREMSNFVVARGPVATIEIGSEVKILAKAMIKQIDRVITDLRNQKREFEAAGGNPVTVGIVGINQASSYVSYEGNVTWPTGASGRKHPVQEAAEAEARLRMNVAAEFDEFLILRFRAGNEPPYVFDWVDEFKTQMDYGAILTRILRKYEARF